MSADLLITRARLDRDLEGILAVDAVTFTNPWTREMYEWEASRSDVSRLFVVYERGPLEREVGVDETGPAEAPGLLLAYCATWFLFDELHINNLAVHPEWRRLGIARRLLEFVLEAGRRAGATQATLEVRRSNHAALKLYEGLGFSVGGVRTGYYRDPVEDALILWRRRTETKIAEAGSNATSTDPVP